MYFRLNPECYFIEGVNSGAIYDLIEGNIISLDKQESIIIKNCEKNELANENDLFLQILRKRCLGNFYKEKVYIEKMRVGSPIMEYRPNLPPVISRVFLEINNRCNKSCKYCGYYGINKSQGCFGCNKWNEKGKELSINQWKKIIDDLADLGCHSIIITGGDLTLDWDRTIEIINYIGDKIPKQYIILNYENLFKEIIEFLQEKVTPIIQIINLENISDNFYYYFINTGKYNPQQGNSFENVMYGVVFEENWEDIFHKSTNSKMNIVKTDVYRFFHLGKMHPCLGNTLTISWKGDIFICPMLRERSLGNINESRIFEIFYHKGEEIEKIWKTTLNSLNKCKYCEFRYSCNDCRAIEQKITGNFLGKVLCNYDPEKGM